MDYMPSVQWQNLGFFYSSGLGFCLGIVFDLFRILFYLITGSDKKYSTLRDIIYLSACTWVVYVFLLVMCDGKLMFYSLVGIAIGLAVYFYSLSDFIYPPVKLILKRIRRFGSRVYDVLRGLSAKIAPRAEKRRKIFDKSGKNYEKYLHIRHGMVYNHSVKLRLRATNKKRGDEIDTS